MKTTRRQTALTVSALLLAGRSVVRAQPSAFPNRPIRIVVPFTAGSGSDSSARYFGDKMATLLGQAVVVENRPGASGVVALMTVKNAPADGYTVLLASNSPMAVNPLVMKDPGYDSVKDYKPVYGLTRGMNVIVVANDSPYGSVDDLLEAAKKKPLTVGTYSAGYELAAAWLAGMAGAKFINVAYKGQAPVMTDIIGKQLDFALVDLGGALSLIQGRKVKALAVSGEARNPDLPAVPTIRERGFKDYVQYSWVSFYVRSTTPDATIATLAEALRKALSTPDAKEFVHSTGGELMPYPPAQMEQFHLSEIDRFRKIAAAAGIKPE
jgi:tripartite-type tricarboxylate transporter receptor subunit TctC